VPQEEPENHEILKWRPFGKYLREGHTAAKSAALSSGKKKEYWVIGNSDSQLRDFGTELASKNSH